MSSASTSRGGFTLIETVIVIALTSVLMIVIGLLIYMFGKISSYERASILSTGSASAFVRDVQTFALPANAVVATHVFASGTYSSSGNTLVLQIPSADSSGVVIANTYDYVVFYISGTNAYRKLEANAASKRVSGSKMLSTTVSSLTFSYNSVDFTQVDTVTIDLQTRAQVKQDILTDHRREQVILRNH